MIRTPSINPHLVVSTAQLGIIHCTPIAVILLSEDFDVKMLPLDINAVFAKRNYCMQQALPVA